MGKAGEVKADSVSSSWPDSSASKLIRTKTIPRYCAPTGKPRPTKAPERIATTGIMLSVNAVCFVVKLGAAKLNNKNGNVVPTMPPSIAI